MLDEIAATADEAGPEGSPWEASCDDFPEDPESGDTFTCAVTANDGSEFPVSVTIDDKGGANFTIGG
ncbi:MAG: DUF4333 domain-containing protein [Euzebya sp.]